MQFQVTALQPDGSILSLTLEAADAQAAQAQAGTSGAQVLRVRARRAFQLPAIRKSSFPLLLFSQQLLALLDAGINVVEAFETLADKEQRPESKAVLTEVVAKLREGLSLSAALERLPGTFPTLFCATVRASERTGGLSEALARYVAYQKQIDTIRKTLVSAAIYPALLIAVGMLVIAFLLGYVVPRFSTVYAEMGDDLPWLSEVLLNWGTFIDRYGIAVLAGLVVAVVVVVRALSQPKIQHRLLDFVWRIPAIGSHMRVYHLARFYRTLGMLLRGGTPAASAMQMVSGLLHSGMRVQLSRALARVREGHSISQAMESEGLVTAVALRMLQVGERTGRMDEMMERIALFHDEEMARWVEWFSKLFEPILMAVIGLMIGAIVLLMYMPIFDLAGNLQ